REPAEISVGQLALDLCESPPYSTRMARLLWHAGLALSDHSLQLRPACEVAKNARQRFHTSQRITHIARQRRQIVQVSAPLSRDMTGHWYSHEDAAARSQQQGCQPELGNPERACVASPALHALLCQLPWPHQRIRLRPDRRSALP